MIRKEFKNNLKSFIIWTGILIVLFLIVYLIYPFFITDEAMESIDEMMKAFSPEFLKAFNMDLISISTAYGWVKSEGMMFILLIIGIYASFYGGNVVLKEEYDKTIEYLGCLPIKRSRILFNKILVAFVYMIGMILIFGIFNYIALLIMGDFNHKEFVLLSISPLLIAFPFFTLNLFLSTLVRKPKKSFAISLGLVFLFYVIQILSELSDKVDFLKYFSIYTLSDTRGIMSNTQINGWCLFISFGFSCIFLLLSFIRYRKKEFVL